MQPAPVTITISRCGEKFVTVDPECIALVSRYKWTANPCGKGKVYARAERHPETRQKISLYMHRLIAKTYIGEPPRAGMVVDHIDGNSLNNCLSNLRWVDAYENRWKLARHKT